MKNKNYIFNKFDLIALGILTVLLIVTLFLYGSYYKKSSQLNIDKIDCDYIAIISSEEENNKIKNSEYAEHVIPYYYFSANINNKSTSNLYVIESFEDSQYTTFSDKLLLKQSTKSVDNEVYIDEEVSKVRIMKLIDLQNSINRKQSETYNGKVVEILCEGYDEKKNKYFGRDTHGRMAYFDGEERNIGEFIKVKIHKTGGISLMGEIVK